jgi:hypothetical protein
LRRTSELGVAHLLAEILAELGDVDRLEELAHRFRAMPAEKLPAPYSSSALR